MKELGDIEWLFHKTGNVQELKDLQEKVLKALRKADGTPVDELDIITLEQIGNLFPESKGLIKSKDRIEFLLERLNDDKVFNKFFQIEE